MAQQKQREPGGEEPRLYVPDPSEQQPYESGALFLTLLAFPNESADDQRLAHLHRALCAAALLERAKDDELWSEKAQLIRPMYLAVPLKQVAASLRTFKRRLRDRMIAGRIANAIMFSAAGLNPKLPKGCEGFSIKQLIKMALDDTDQLEAENAEQRIWRDGLPAVHLAAALQAYLNRKDKADREVSIGDILFDETGALAEIARQALVSYHLMKDHPDRFKLGRRRPILFLFE